MGGDLIGNRWETGGDIVLNWYGIGELVGKLCETGELSEPTGDPGDCKICSIVVAARLLCFSFWRFFLFGLDVPTHRHRKCVVSKYMTQGTGTGCKQEYGAVRGLGNEL